MATTADNGVNVQALLEAREYRGEAADAAGAFPQSASPLFWSGVVETDNTMDELEVSFAPGTNFDPESARIFYKAEPSIALEAARRSDVGIAFLEFARFPLARVQSEDDGYRITMRDLRFDGARAERNVIARIDVDANNNVTRQEFLFNTANVGDAYGEDTDGGK